MRIAIFGASGFVGSTLVEQLMRDGQTDNIKAFIRGAGSAWRLARHAELPLESVDILSGKELHAALEGCTHVVNCTRGDNDVMHTGLKNMLKESKAAGVQRFVHISSVAVYGDPPPPEARNESRPARPDKGSYGDTKLRQDRMISAAYRGGLSCANLCPPNISGAYSGFVGNVLSTQSTGSSFVMMRGACCQSSEAMLISCPMNASSVQDSHRTMRQLRVAYDACHAGTPTPMQSIPRLNSARLTPRPFASRPTTIAGG